VTYIVNESCIRCEYTDCVEVCPVDCFYEGENMLVIHPDECIDCGVCEPECPVDAIKPDTEPGIEKWLDTNSKYSQVWPNITKKKPAPPDADAFVNVPDKFAKYFSPNPGEGAWAGPSGQQERRAVTMKEPPNDQGGGGHFEMFLPTPRTLRFARRPSWGIVARVEGRTVGWVRS
jgi:ferredoxin